jgi:TPR repeat protein
MYEHGLGLKRDLHLAKRYYDLALTIEPGALIAIRLSLWHLWLRTRWEESWAPMLHARGWIGAEWLKRPAPSAADWFAGLFGTSSSRGYLHGNQSAVLAQTTTSAAQPDSTPASSLVSTVSTVVLKSLRAASNGFVECWEDLALMVVGAALVIVVAVRARHI